MPAKTKYVKVAVPIRSDKTFTYLLPENLESAVSLGSEVLVPLGKRRVSGFVVGYDDEPVEGMKEIIKPVREEPLFAEDMLRLTRWLADYYMCSWGEALKAAIPAGAQTRERKYVEALRKSGEDLSTKEREALSKLTGRGAVSTGYLAKLLPGTDTSALLSRLERKKAVRITTSLGQSTLEPLTETTLVVLNREEAARQVEALERRAPRQGEILKHLLLSPAGRATLDQLKQSFSFPLSSAQGLRKKGLIGIEETEVMTDASLGMGMEEPQPPELTPEQARALSLIGERMEEGSYKTVLLHGVTGSGKTEVYLRAAAMAIGSEKQAIILVPEISLTPQTASRFISRFGRRVAILHSRLSARERADIWRRIAEGDSDVVIGPRSAVFAPTRRLGLIVVDEEHEPSYKQADMTPRYHARDVAVMRARIVNCVCLLGSATPSLESYYNGLTGKYDLVEIPRRIDGRSMPEAEVVDMKEEEDTAFSRVLKEKIADRLGKGEQVMLFLNRRGFSRFILCRDCGFVERCPSCSVSLTYHQAARTLVCHYCGFRKSAYDICPGCKGNNLLLKGFGTERVEEKLKESFPGIRVLRMDMDTTRKRHAHRDIFRTFRNHKADVLLGTQMIAKGLDFPELTLVGVISADTSVNLPDLRSAERTFQLLAQVAGRTGRSNLGGQVVIQTFSPDLSVIRTAAEQKYRAFFDVETAQRGELDYPPFSRMTKLSVRSTDRASALDTAEKLKQAIEKRVELNGSGIVVLGPAPAAVFRLKGEYRYTILLKAKGPMQAQKTIRPALSDLPVPGKVKLVVDIDPVDVF